MIQKAAEFAAHVHAGALRKGSKLPYIVHPREVAMIVAMMTEDPEVIAAAYLHDVIEDAGVRYEADSIFRWRVRVESMHDHASRRRGK